MSEINHVEAMKRARLSLLGLSVGDGFGEQFFTNNRVLEKRFETREIPPPRWFVTDDTMMAISIVENLEQHGRVDQDVLAEGFAMRHAREPDRGYAGMALRILRGIGEGVPWRQAAGEVFEGTGSMGNGAAMRVAPLGGYFAMSDVEIVVREAALSAEVTHMHPEGKAGAIATALAAMYAATHGAVAEGQSLLQFVHEHTPRGDTRAVLRRAMELPLERSPRVAAEMLGSGYEVISQDTVPFALWCAARHLDNYVEAMWSTVSGLGDRDTTCAIAGGIVALAVGEAGIPEEWVAYREALPA